MAPLLTFYGDDFTGSSAVMEVLSFAGVPTMLFTQAPTAETLAQYPNIQAVGVAGIARSQSPEWMKETLPPIFEALDALGAPLLHYKVCSTFDSSPETGSIGVATEIGMSMSEDGWVPLVVGAPAIRRFQVFGQLFAGAGEEVHRLDRHPVMSCHPVTPMDEADLCRHLSHQTDLGTGIVSLEAMKAGRGDAALRTCLENDARIIAIDTLDDETLEEAGRLIWQDGAKSVFAVGSQGVEYALVAHWRKTGALAPDHTPPKFAPVDQFFAVSGSCAPTTAEQIDHADALGARIVELDASSAVDVQSLDLEVARVLTSCLTHLSEGKDVIVATARGPKDPALTRMSEALEKSQCSSGVANDRLGHALGSLVAQVRVRTGLSRIAICGGDTSSHALSELNVEALSAVAPLAPGAPLCRVHSQSSPDIDGLEVTLKGGQMGPPAFFEHMKTGRF